MSRMFSRYFTQKRGDVRKQRLLKRHSLKQTSLFGISWECSAGEKLRLPVKRITN
jgi:hypothetical protein